MTTPADHSTHTALVTGANSGLGFEAARQLAEAGYGSIVLACRTSEKAEAAREQLRELTGRDPFSTIAVDVAEIDSSTHAAQELVERGTTYDAILLNAGMVPSELSRTSDGIETCFASSLIGHHLLTTALLDADLVNPDAAVVLVGSEAANNDLPRAMGMSVYDFVLGEPSEFGDSPHDAMEHFAKASAGPKYNGSRQYSSTKAFSAWWSAAMARRHDEGVRFNTVSPGANMGTNAGRHAKGAFKVMVAFMGRFGKALGMDQPVDQGAKRYLDVLHGVGGPYENGRTYTSKPKKMTGPITVCEQGHLLDRDRQDLALAVLDDLSATE
jgi:NAD(P)-dependent dehydrogenase (short-subunit alcohol dehydrogenase family)